jgi:two-component system, NarL family, invasion response regulator UvrY
MIRVLVADDHAVVRRGLRQILAETPDIHVGGEAADGAEVLRLVRAERWDVVVLDINLQRSNGLEILAEIRRERPDLPVLILTVYSEEQYALRAVKAGAAGFLNKESAQENLIDAVRKVAGGGRYVTAALAERLATFVAAKHEGAPHEKLSNREFEIMKLIASGKSVGEIARDLALSAKTVSTHRTRILGKMDVKTNAELTHYAVRNKLVE